MNQIKLLDIKIDNISYKDTLKEIEDFIASKKPHQICTVNPEYLMQSKKDEELKHILNQSALNVADGGGLLYGARYTRQKLDYKVTGVDLIWKIAELSNKKQYRIFLLGGENDVAIKTAQILRHKFPKINIAGTFEGKPLIKLISRKIWQANYRVRRSLDMRRKSNINKNNSQIMAQIAKAKPDILLVAYGCPKQDKFIARYAQYLNVPVMIGVGGAFDYISGKISRAPVWMRNIHLEWLYRLFAEPKRFNRIITATIRFPLAVIKHKK